MGLVHRLFYKEFIFASFDPDMAVALGRRARWWNVLLFLTIGVTISSAIRAAGALVVLNFLLLPAATALVATRSLSSAFVLSIVFGVVASFVGIVISYIAGWPIGPAIAGVSLAILLLAGLVNLFRR